MNNIHLFRFLCTLPLVFILSCSKPAAPAPPAIPTQKVVLEDSLGAPANADWQKNWKVIEGNTTDVHPEQGGLRFTLPAAGTIKIGRQLDLAPLRGGVIYLSSDIQSENVTNPPNPWNGLKLMIHFTMDNGSSFYPNAKLETGTWGPEKKGKLISVPQGAVSAELTIGIEKVQGSALFSNLKILMVEPPLADEAKPVTEGAPHAGHNLPRLRGAMVQTTISPESLRTFGQEWNGNLIRWQLGSLRFRETGLETPDFDKVLDKELADLDALLPFCKEYGLYVVLDLHSLSHRLFHSTANQDKLVEIWKKMAAKYKDNDVIWAYDIANEPRMDDWTEGVQLWNALADRVARAIRTVDPDKTIIVEPEMMGVPEGFATLRPVSAPNVVYSVHMYNPGVLTHNKVWDKNQATWSYPGEIDGKYWDKAEIERNLKPVIDFQKKYNVHIYVGEFGCVRWSPGYGQYLNDCIEVFEEHGWDWSYHAFREWDGWSVEHDTDPAHKKPPETLPPAGEMMRSWLAKNKKPEWATP